jgi:glucose-1-phosphate cytidylyltransferase
MKAVILAGGRGTRLAEETVSRPKPMVEVGGKPILWHIMKIYAQHGVRDFVVCLGYKGYMIKEYFANYFLHNSDATVNLSTGEMKIHRSRGEDWSVTLADTGEDTLTATRLKIASRYLTPGEDFFFTYGDGVSNVDISASLAQHRATGVLATMTVANSPGRFGLPQLDETGVRVASFEEKPDLPGQGVNAGFFVLSPGALDYIGEIDCLWEQGPLQRLCDAKQLGAWRHTAFWQPMDTLRDKEHLEELWRSGKAPWKVWGDAAPVGQEDR